MSTKSTKSNKQLTYPCIVNICKAMGSKRKSEVIRAIDRVTGEDLSKAIVYPTLRNAFYAGVDLVKESIDSKWQRIEKADAEKRQIIEETGLCAGIAEAEAPAPVVATKPAKASKPAKAAKAPKAKTAKTAGQMVSKKKAAVDHDDDYEPSDAEIAEIDSLLMSDEDVLNMFDEQ